MVNSMTGFGSSQGQDQNYRWTIEVRSVNARGLDIRLRLPEGIDGLEKTIRGKISKVAKRGNISVSLRLLRENTDQSFEPDPQKLSAALRAIKTVQDAADYAGLGLTDVRATDILALRGVQDSARDQSPEKSTLDALTSDFDKALESFVAMRAEEGIAIRSVMSDQVTEISRLTEASVKAAGKRSDRMRKSIEAALLAITSSTDAVDSARIEAELAMIAVKSDVTEEIDRLRTHVVAARGLLEGDGAVGRKLDFLTQEFNREANTLCSKAQSAELTAIGLDLKAVIDQMREQVQNLE